VTRRRKPRGAFGKIKNPVESILNRIDGLQNKETPNILAKVSRLALSDYVCIHFYRESLNPQSNIFYLIIFIRT